MSPRTRLWALGAALFALAAAAFFQFFEKRSFDFDVGYQGEAARNPYLAAQRLLERMGLEVRSLKLAELVALPPTDGTLLLPTPRATLSAQRSRELVDWVVAGGHLLVVTWTLWDEENRRGDPILDPLDFRQYAQLEPESDGAEGFVADEVARVPVTGRDEPLEVIHDPRFRFEDAAGRATWFVEDANGMHLVQTEVGDGLLTALTDDYLLTNFRISQRDHAELVYRLARAGGRGGPVWIVFAEEWPGPWQLLWENGWPVVVTLALLVFAWIWLRALRFGPMLPDPPRDRRSLMEHVEAAGRFHWKHGAGAQLTESVRGALMDRVRLRHPAWLELPPAELHERLAAISDVPRERIDHALAFRADLGPERFAQNVAIMEKITRAI